MSFLHITQHWTKKRLTNGQWCNPIDGQRLKHTDEVGLLLAHEIITPSSVMLKDHCKAELGYQVYKVHDNGSLELIKHNYDTSD